MTPDRWQRINRIFHATLACPSDQRDQFLTKACADDPSLKSEIESIIQAHEKTGKLIDKPAHEAVANLAVEAQSLSAGQRVGHYTIVSSLGAGGMGEVYLADDSQLHRRVAIKLLPEHFSSNPDRLRRFAYEARAASALNHPNILTIHEIGEESFGRYIVSEFVDGLTLRHLLAGSPLQLDEALDITIQISSALVAAHKQGIVHRDIKPENVMVRSEDRLVKVLDFGLAKATEKQMSDEQGSDVPTRVMGQTGAGVVMGTVAYMSPEQARGLQVDERTDIWSVGVVLYEMIAGKIPFAGSSANDIVSAILSKEQAVPLARYANDLPEELERIVTKALRKERDQRYQTIKDLMLDLQALKQRLDFESSHSELRGKDYETVGVVDQTTSQPNVAASTLADSSNKLSLIGFAASRKKYVVLGFVGLLILASVLTYWLKFRRDQTTTPEIRSLAVLPLANLSGDSSQNYFADGMTEELITSLSKIRPLRVISRMSTIQYKGTTKSLKDIAQELNVDAVLSGSVLRSGDRVRINVQLIHGATDTHLWAESYDRALSDVLALQSDVGRAIASEIRINLTPVEKGMFASSKALNPKALESYLRGRDFFYQGRNQKTADKYNEFLLTSIRHFEQAISIEPNYALAYCGLSRANHWLASSTRPDLWPAAKDAALKAIQIDEEEAEGHAALAFILQVHDWDLSRSEREYKRALELNPSYSDAHGGYSLVLTAVGRHDEAIRHSALGIELDPLTLPLRTIHAYLFIYARQYEQAIKSYQDLQQKFSDGDVSSRLGEAYIYSRKYEEGIKVFHEAGGSSAPRSAIVAWAYARAGKRDEANKILAAAIESLASGGRVSKLRIAWAYAALGDNDQAFAWLEKAYSDHADGLIYLKVHPAFESLHSDPRFKDLVRRIGLPE